MVTMARRSTRGKAKSATLASALNIIYVSFTAREDRPYLDPSCRYRCFYPAEAARLLGHRSFVATQSSLSCLNPENFDLAVVHRPSFTPDLLRFVDKAREAGVRLVADYDDLIFDPACALESSIFLRNWDMNAALRIFEQNTDALRLFDNFTVSTTPLREHILNIHPNAEVSVLPNSVSPALWSAIRSRKYEHRIERQQLGYFPGTATHDEDFRVAAESVATFCRENKVALRLVGPVSMDPETFRGVEVKREPLLPYGEMFDALGDCRVVVAPLAPTRFNRAKSNIKLLEATLACSGCVATGIPDMIGQGPPVSHASTVDEHGDWRSALQERWDAYDVGATDLARHRLVQNLGSVVVNRPNFRRAA